LHRLDPGSGMTTLGIYMPVYKRQAFPNFPRFTYYGLKSLTFLFIVGKIKTGKEINMHQSKKNAVASTKSGRPAILTPGGRHLTTKVTTKGQITVPKTVREHLKLAKGDRIEFLIGIDGKVTLMAATADIRKLKGMVPKPAKPVSVADMNRSIEAEGGAIK
jgi:antitoxin PrlF